MPRGVSSSGKCNAQVTRYVCPDCNRKGLHCIYTSYYSTYKPNWVCMYRNCPSYSNGKLFKDKEDAEVLKVNPILSQTATV